MTRIYHLIRPAIFALLFMSGCSGGGDSDKHPPLPPPLTASDIHALGPEQLQKLITGAETTVLMINVWATWCIPCREEFPDLVRLHQRYADRGLKLVAISVDYPDEVESKILPFVNSHSVPFPVFVQTFPRQEDFINFLNTKWSGALPATFIYDRSGSQQVFLLGQHSLPELEKAIQPLL